MACVWRVSVKCMDDTRVSIALPCTVHSAPADGQPAPADGIETRDDTALAEQRAAEHATTHPDPSATVRDLCARVRDALCVPVERQRIIFRGRVLTMAMNEPLARFGVTDGVCLHLVARAETATASPDYVAMLPPGTPAGSTSIAGTPGSPGLGRFALERAALDAAMPPSAAITSPSRRVRSMLAETARSSAESGRSEAADAPVRSSVFSELNVRLQEREGTAIGAAARLPFASHGPQTLEHIHQSLHTMRTVLAATGWRVGGHAATAARPSDAAAAAEDDSMAPAAARAAPRAVGLFESPPDADSVDRLVSPASDSRTIAPADTSASERVSEAREAIDEIDALSAELNGVQATLEAAPTRSFVENATQRVSRIRLRLQELRESSSHPQDAAAHAPPSTEADSDEDVLTSRTTLLPTATHGTRLSTYHRCDRTRRCFVVGQWVDVLDTVEQWLEATILAIQGNRVLVHYNGWPARWREWIHVESPRIAPFRTRTQHATLGFALCPQPVNHMPITVAPHAGRPLNADEAAAAHRLDNVPAGAFMPPALQNTLLQPEHHLTTPHGDVALTLAADDPRVALPSVVEHAALVNDMLHRLTQLTQTQMAIEARIAASDAAERQTAASDAASAAPDGSNDAASASSSPARLDDLDVDAVSTPPSRSARAQPVSTPTGRTAMPAVQSQREAEVAERSQLVQEAGRLLSAYQRREDMLAAASVRYEVASLASQLAPLLDRMGRVIADMAPFVEQLARTPALTPARVSTSSLVTSAVPNATPAATPPAQDAPFTTVYFRSLMRAVAAAPSGPLPPLAELLRVPGSLIPPAATPSTPWRSQNRAMSSSLRAALRAGYVGLISPPHSSPWPESADSRLPFAPGFGYSSPADGSVSLLMASDAVRGAPRMAGLRASTLRSHGRGGGMFTGGGGVASAMLSQDVHTIALPLSVSISLLAALLPSEQERTLPPVLGASPAQATMQSPASADGGGTDASPVLLRSLSQPPPGPAS